MRSYRNLFILIVLLAALAVPVCTSFAAPKPKAILDLGPLATANVVFPGTNYDNPVTQAAETDGATGDFTVNQAASNKRVVIQAWLYNLQPSTTYRVYLDTNGINESAPSGDRSTAGPFSLLDTITTDADGYGYFYQQTLDLAPGTYQWTLFINQIGYRFNYTVLISENLDFEIAP
jgi:hypothetical protein